MEITLIRKLIETKKVRAALLNFLIVSLVCILITSEIVIRNYVKLGTFSKIFVYLLEPLLLAYAILIIFSLFVEYIYKKKMKNYTRFSIFLENGYETQMNILLEKKWDSIYESYPYKMYEELSTRLRKIGLRVRYPELELGKSESGVKIFILSHFRRGRLEYYWLVNNIPLKSKPKELNDEIDEVIKFIGF